MERLMGFVKTLVYLIVAIVVYCGVNQVIYVAKAAELDLGFDWRGIWLLDEVESENQKQVKVINQYLESQHSPLIGLGDVFVENAHLFDLPVYLMPAMTGAESGFGKVGYATNGTYNAVGLGIHEGRKYESWEEGIVDMAWVLRNYYFDEGRDDPISIQNKWAPRCVDGNSCDNSWADNVNFFINEMVNLEKEISI
ncbi:glucosaminidase domain-containing protein [Patescibacteria group bacterium]|nr:glucosaminidase domain-containing protein [Patescibacteria group bacterium]